MSTTMASSESPIPLKRAELPIQKFNEVGIPHHLGLLKNHKSNIEKNVALGDWDKVRKEEINATRVIKQLKSLLLEMDMLRSRICANDIDKFDECTLEGRQKAMDGIKDYFTLQLKTPSAKSSKQNSFEDYENQDLEIDDIPQIQADFQLSEHQLRTRQACLNEFENLQREISDIHDLFFKLNGTVIEQAEHVDVVEEHVDEAQVSVEEAEKSLKQALTYKKAMYPLCGAVLGFCIAGPIGMVTFGLKAGSLAAVSCGILGATGGTVIKNREEVSAGDVQVQTEAERKDE